MKRKYVYLMISILIAAIIAGSLYMRHKRNTTDSGNFPPSATQEDRDASNKLPREKCACWEGGNAPDAHCGPQQDCI